MSWLVEIPELTVLGNPWSFSGGVGVVEQWVYRLDGASQSWQLTEPVTAPENKDFTCSFYIQGSRRSEVEGLISDGVGMSWLRILGSNQSQDLQMLIGGSYKGASYPSGYDLRDGGFNLFKFFRVNGGLFFSINDSGPRSMGTSAAEFSIEKLMVFSNQYFAGVIYDFEFEMDGVLTNSIPLTNKDQGANQLATVGSINAELINYTEDGWERLDDRDEYERSINNSVEAGYVADYFA